MNKLTVMAGMKTACITKKELAAKLWPDSTKSAQYQNMRLMLQGKMKDFEKSCIYIKIIAQEIGMEPKNFI